MRCTIFISERERERERERKGREGRGRGRERFEDIDFENLHEIYNFYYCQKLGPVFYYFHSA